MYPFVRLDVWQTFYAIDACAKCFPSRLNSDFFWFVMWVYWMWVRLYSVDGTHSEIALSIDFTWFIKHIQSSNEIVLWIDMQFDVGEHACTFPLCITSIRYEFLERKINPDKHTKRTCRAAQPNGKWIFVMMIYRWESGIKMKKQQQREHDIFMS